MGGLLPCRHGPGAALGGAALRGLGLGSKAPPLAGVEQGQKGTGAKEALPELQGCPAAHRVPARSVTGRDHHWNLPLSSVQVFVEQLTMDSIIRGRRQVIRRTQGVYTDMS